MACLFLLKFPYFLRRQAVNPVFDAYGDDIFSVLTNSCSFCCLVLTFSNAEETEQHNLEEHYYFCDHQACYGYKHRSSQEKRSQEMQLFLRPIFSYKRGISGSFLQRVPNSFTKTANALRDVSPFSTRHQITEIFTIRGICFIVFLVRRERLKTNQHRRQRRVSKMTKACVCTAFSWVTLKLKCFCSIQSMMHLK